MHRGSVPWLLIVVAGVALAVFGALTATVTLGPSLALDSWAFEIADDLRAPWLDAAARVVTTLGLLAIVGSGVLLSALVLVKRRYVARAGVLMLGAALTWVGVWIAKAVVDRPASAEPACGDRGPKLSLGPRRRRRRLARARDRPRRGDRAPWPPDRRDHRGAPCSPCSSA